MEIKNKTQGPSSAASRTERVASEGLLGLDRAPGKNNATGASDKAQGFNVAVSSEAQELKAARQKAFDIAKSTSPVREDRVAELKAKIKNGTYQIDSGNIADGILREAIREKLATEGRE
jgi:flagellar biosynthesis anti-sigma factor FlgM